jgi:hypothetical protein
MLYNYKLFSYEGRELARTRQLDDETAIARLCEEAGIEAGITLVPYGGDPSAEFYMERSDPNAAYNDPVRTWLKRRANT